MIAILVALDRKVRYQYPVSIFMNFPVTFWLNMKIWKLMSHVVRASSEYGLKHSMESKKPAITNFFAGRCFDFLLTICAIVYSVFFYYVIETIIKHEKMLFFNWTFKMLFRGGTILFQLMSKTLEISLDVIIFTSIVCWESKSLIIINR